MPLGVWLWLDAVDMTIRSLDAPAQDVQITV